MPNTTPKKHERMSPEVYFFPVFQLSYSYVIRKLPTKNEYA